VLNPVRAGLVDSAETYPWSSLRATLALTEPPAWLATGVLLVQFGSRARYLEFVREGVGQGSPWAGVRGGVLGSDLFLGRHAGRIEQRAGESEFPRRERLVHRETVAAFFPPTVAADPGLRNVRIRELVASGRYSAAEIGRHLGLHYSTVSRIMAARPTPGRPDEQIQDLTPATARR
jgi:hypothetical protein